MNLKSIITNDHQLIAESNYIVLPGVGSFKQGMINLKEHKLDELLTKLVIHEKKNFLGICLGMQLLLSDSEEFGFHQGLNFIPGSVKHFKHTRLDFHESLNRIDLVQTVPPFGIKLQKKHI